MSRRKQSNPRHLDGETDNRKCFCFLLLMGCLFLCLFVCLFVFPTLFLLFLSLFVAVLGCLVLLFFFNKLIVLILFSVGNKTSIG